MKKEQIINYLVDVLGYLEEEARKEIAVYGINCLTDKQKEEAIEYTN